MPAGPVSRPRSRRCLDASRMTLRRRHAVRGSLTTGACDESAGLRWHPRRRSGPVPRRRMGPSTSPNRSRTPPHCGRARRRRRVAGAFGDVGHGGPSIDDAEQLRVIGRAGAGVDTIDVDAATARGIAVMNAPDGNTLAAAEHALSLLFALARHVPRADAGMKAGRVAQGRPHRLRTGRQEARRHRPGPHRRHRRAQGARARHGSRRLRSVPAALGRGPRQRAVEVARRTAGVGGRRHPAHSAHQGHDAPAQREDAWRG